MMNNPEGIWLSLRNETNWREFDYPLRRRRERPRDPAGLALGRDIGVHYLGRELAGRKIEVYVTGGKIDAA